MRCLGLHEVCEGRPEKSDTLWHKSCQIIKAKSHFYDDDPIIARWVCTSGRPEDLATTDRLAKEVLEQQVGERSRDYNYF